MAAVGALGHWMTLSGLFAVKYGLLGGTVVSGKTFRVLGLYFRPMLMESGALAPKKLRIDEL